MADDFSLSGIWDETASLDPSLFNLSGTETAGFDLGGLGGNNLLFDTLTGQFVTPEQATLLDPSWDASMLSNLPSGGGSWLPTNMNDWLKLGAGALGLGATGLGAAGIAQGLTGGARQGPSSTGTTGGTQSGTSTTTPGPMSPELQYLYSQMGGPEYGGLQGLAGHSLVQNMGPSGLMNQQAGILGQLYGNAPNADPYLNQQLMQNAYGMAGGGLPALTPQLQNQINQIYGSQWANIDRYLQDYLGNVRDRMNNQGWEGSAYDVLRQGPGQALFAPGIAEATRQQGLLAGQAAQAGINLAQQLPMQALQLGTGVLNQGLAANQNQQNIAQGFNTPIALRNQLPIALFQGLNANRGTTTTSTGMTSGTGTQSQQLPPMTLLDAFAPTAGLLGGLGGLAGGVAGMTKPPGT